jgi:hypothetical protein
MASRKPSFVRLTPTCTGRMMAYGNVHCLIDTGIDIDDIDMIDMI